MQPPPPPRPPAPGAPPTIVVPPAAAPPRRRGRVVVGIVVGVVGLLLIGGGIAYATVPPVRILVNSWLPFLDGSRPTAATVLPGDSAMFLSVDVDPTSEQKVAMYDFLDEFPVLDTVTSSDEPFAQAVLEAVVPPEAGLDYTADVEPWLGHTIGITYSDLGTTLSETGEYVTPDVTIAIASTNDEAARAAIEKLAGAPLDDTQLAFRDGFAIVSASGTLPEAGTPTLAETAMPSEIDQLGGVGPLVYWQDNDAIVEFYGALAPYAYGLGDPSATDAEDPFADVEFGTFAMTARFADGSLELAGRTFGVHDYGVPMTQATADIATSLPADTAAFLQVEGLGPMLQYVWNNAETLYGEMFSTEQIAEFKSSAQSSVAEYGLDLNTDLEVLFGQQLVLSASPQAYDTVMTGPPGGLGVLVQTDTAAMEALMAPIVADAASSGTTIATASQNGVFMATFDEPYLATLQAGGDLGAQPGFARALPDLAAANGAFYADLRVLPDIASTFGIPDDVVANLGSLEAVGATVTSTGGSDSAFRVVVTTTGGE